MNYVEIFIESISTYFYLIIMLRLLGKKEMSKLTISDLIVFLLISELMTISIGNDDINFLHGALAVIVIVVLDKLCSYLSMKFKPLKKILEGHPTFIVCQGQLQQEKMASLNYTVEDLCHHLREQGISSLSEVEFAVLETDGNLSVIKKEDNQTIIPDSLIKDGKINYDILEIIQKDEQWLLKELKKAGINNYQEVFYCVLEDHKLFYIKKN